MKKTIFLLSHSPIPRFLKRMEVSSQVSKTFLVYWDRNLTNDILFTVPADIGVKKILLAAPQGNLKKRIFKYLLFIPRALRKLKKIKPNTIHAGNFDMLFIAFLYKKLLNSKVNIIYEIGDLPNIVFLDSTISKIFIWIEKILLTSVKKMILTSPYFYSEYYKEIVKEEKVLIIPNVPSKKLITKEKILGVNNESGTPRRIGFIGAVRYKREIIKLIDVSVEMNFEVQISGVGLDYAELRKYCHNKNNIKFTGPYNYKDIESLYSDIDLVYSVYDVLKPNVKLALPNRLYEAILFEKPIIVADGTKLAEFVRVNNIGFVVGNNIDQEIKKVINQINNNPEVLLLKVRNCKNIKEKYTYESYEELIRSLY